MAPFVALWRGWPVVGVMMQGSSLMNKTYSSKTPSRRRRAHRRRTQPLLFNGIGAMVAGALLWVMSWAMAVEESLKAASKALLAPAWMALVLGAGLLVLHVLSTRRAQAEAATLLRQHSTFLEPMPRLKTKHREKPGFSASQQRSSATGR